MIAFSVFFFFRQQHCVKL